MLRLWPDEVQIGLFTDHCWVRRRGGTTQDYAAPQYGDDAELSDGSGAELLRMLGSILADPASGIRAGSRVALTVSDTLAAIVTMPWQESLGAAAEQRQYARLLFEREGRDIGTDWTIRADFFAYASQGLAFALPNVLLSTIERMVGERGLVLQRVLPATAAAFYLPLGSSVGRHLFILHEPTRSSALVFSSGRFDGFDVEPTIAGSVEGPRRLLCRISATHGVPNHILQWCSYSDGRRALETLTAAELPETKSRFLAREAMC